MKLHSACVNNSAVTIITGDIFHHKSKLDSFSITMFNKMIDLISALTPIYVILGNHDFRQDKPDTPDLISSVLNDARQNVFFMKDTGYYVAGNIGFGLVSVKDTLLEGTSSGKQIEELPEFPSPFEFPDNVDTTVALFHGTVIACKLQNYTESTDGYPIKWFNGYDVAMLGDVHLQQIRNIDSEGTWNKKKVVWAYPGSIIQQNFGEEIINHGFLDWDMINRTVHPVNIYNDKGMLKLKFTKDSWCLTNGDRLHTIIESNLFPKNVDIRIMCSYEIEIINQLKSLMIDNDVKYTISFVNNTVLDDGENNREESEYSNEVIANLNTPENWINYINDRCGEKPMHKDWKSWIHDPEKLQCIVNDSLPISLHEKATKKNKEFIEDIQKTNLFENLKTNKFKIKYLEWSWILCFKDNCWFNFEDLNGFTGMVAGQNGSGKTSFLETIAVALFGECTPAKSSPYQSSSSGYMIHKNKPKDATASTTMHFEYNDVVYKIHRTFRKNPQDMEKLKDTTVTIMSSALSCALSGNKTCSDWIKYNIGSIDEFIKYTMLTQFDNKDFFTLSDQEQIRTIESSQNIDAVNNLDSILSNAVKMQTTLIASVQDVYNNNLATTSTFDENEFNDNKVEIEKTQRSHRENTATLKNIDIKNWLYINTDDFDDDHEKNIQHLNTEIQTIEDQLRGGVHKSTTLTGDLSHEQLLVEKGAITGIFDIVKTLKKINYDDPIETSMTYLADYDNAIKMKNKIQSQSDQLLPELNALKLRYKQIRKDIREARNNNKQPKQDEEFVNSSIERFHILNNQRNTISKNISKHNKFFEKHSAYESKLQSLTNDMNEDQIKIDEIQCFDHPFNPDCEKCKLQSWKVDRENTKAEYESKVDEYAIVFKRTKTTVEKQKR